MSNHRGQNLIQKTSHPITNVLKISQNENFATKGKSKLEFAESEVRKLLKMERKFNEREI